MQLNAQQVVTQFAHLLQQEMFPKLEQVVGPLSKDLELLAAVMALVPLQRLLTARRASTGRPAKDRAALATAFVAKAILNLCTTRDLLSRLQVDQALREFCGWRTVKAMPHESKFSRAFAEFAESELPQQWHEAVIAATQKERLIGHIARDSTAIAAREHYPESGNSQTAEGKGQAKQKTQEETHARILREKESERARHAHSTAAQATAAANAE